MIVTFTTNELINFFESRRWDEDLIDNIIKAMAAMYIEKLKGQLKKLENPSSEAAKLEIEIKQIQEEFLLNS